MRVALLGHSHCRRLKEWMEKEGKQFNVEHVSVEFFALGGLTVQKFFRNERQHGLLGHMISYKPDMVCVMLGDNDLMKMKAQRVVTDFERLIDVLKKKLNVTQFLFFQVLPRGAGAEGSEAYRERALDLHQRMRGWKETEDGVNVMYFCFRDQRFFLSKPVSSSCFISARDQVHLNDAGYRKLFSGVQYGLRTMVRKWNVS